MKTDNKRKLRNDLMLIAVLLTVSVLAGLCLWLIRGEGDTVTVTVDGDTYGVYSLTEEREVEITTPHGRNLLVIRDGRAQVTEANCPDAICANHRPIHRSGESIVCLPHKVVVTVTATHSDTPDVVV
ncbi:MAG: NusG domain II-containing protein [Clostridia bacterium]|nr:NusG domain II-containing protein [Clostridia bacterium]